ncbi:MULTISPECIES: sulfurtransferase [unclassified Paenibacillus]|uniref:sulfurtransferase n=1 Tax=unclassified Paenibacillus TaxID=185978 RepID=UPI0021182B2A|nr:MULTISPECIES: sulfurtransferase [unclassified Paenibacillus]
MSYIVDSHWVKDQIERLGENLVLADCRFVLGQSESGRNAYAESHLPGAIYVDLEKDLSAPVGEHGGRHPLPDPQLLADRLGQLGIRSSSTVVAYDDQGGAMASRLWWVLHYLGHDKVSVLNGGFAQWVKDGYETTKVIPDPTPRTYVPQIREGLLLHAEDVKARLHRPGTILVDSREPKRYLGLEEPIDKAAGHIPGAVNLFWKEVLTTQGLWKNEEDLKGHFAQLPSDREIVVYCGSGVTACPNVLALKSAGFANVKLYAGSWSDWISYGENPIATGSE